MPLSPATRQAARPMAPHCSTRMVSRTVRRARTPPSEAEPALSNDPLTPYQPASMERPPGRSWSRLRTDLHISLPRLRDSEASIAIEIATRGRKEPIGASITLPTGVLRILTTITVGTARVDGIRTTAGFSIRALRRFASRGVIGRANVRTEVRTSIAATIAMRAPIVRAIICAALARLAEEWATFPSSTVRAVQASNREVGQTIARTATGTGGVVTTLRAIPKLAPETRSVVTILAGIGSATMAERPVKMDGDEIGGSNVQGGTIEEVRIEASTRARTLRHRREESSIESRPRIAGKNGRWIEIRRRGIAPKSPATPIAQDIAAESSRSKLSARSARSLRRS